MENKKEIKEETVEISKKRFEDIIDRMERLESVASKARLGLYDDKHRGPVGQVVSIRKIGKKYVVGWSSMIDNTVEQNVITGRWEEIQRVKIFFLDDTEKEMTYKQWKNRYTKEKCDVLSEVKNSNGSTDITLKLPDGEKVTLDVKFLN